MVSKGHAWDRMGVGCRRHMGSNGGRVKKRHGIEWGGGDMHAIQWGKGVEDTWDPMVERHGLE